MKPKKSESIDLNLNKKALKSCLNTVSLPKKKINPYPNPAQQLPLCLIVTKGNLIS